MTLDFQSIIFKLQNYWHEQGCLIWQPYHTEVGAGTMNPATFLRVLGPEPWNVAYVEPGIRPDDARYGGSGVGPGNLAVSDEGCMGRPYSMELTLPPLDTLILRPR